MNIQGVKIHYFGSLVYFTYVLFNIKLSITGSWLTSTFCYNNRVLAIKSFLTRHTAENISKQIDKAIEKLRIDVIAITRDGASNVTASCKRTNIPRYFGSF
jgi:uncharacterized protein with PIN domain